jgi:hypothetical protein
MMSVGTKVVGASGDGAQQLQGDFSGRCGCNGHWERLRGGFLPALPEVVGDIPNNRALQLGRDVVPADASPGRWRGLSQRSPASEPRSMPPTRRLCRR